MPPRLSMSHVFAWVAWHDVIKPLTHWQSYSGDYEYSGQFNVPCLIVAQYKLYIFKKHLKG